MYVFISVTLTLIHLLGLVTAVNALYWSKTSQAALAWGLSLIMFPYGALPAYWIFGRSRFRGYRKLERSFEASRKASGATYQQFVQQHRKVWDEVVHPVIPPLERISDRHFMAGNKVDLLIDGRMMFDSLFQALLHAKEYVFLEFYIFRDDKLGNELSRKLIECAKRGVRVVLLYDEMGCVFLGDCIVDDMRKGGVEVLSFNTRRGPGNFFQVNFRNHRKIVIIDGMFAYVGGLNVGDEYLGEDKTIGPWRDTSIKIEGPGALEIQTVFFADYLWASGRQVEVPWQVSPPAGDTSVLALASGPAVEKERCFLFFVEMINSAKKRIWLSSPYFVPDESIVTALQLAVLRGVDVRLLLPDMPDQLFVWLASLSYVPEVIANGVRVYHYTDGFLHQKAVLVDDEIAAIGSANLDNRSFRLNFEIMAIVADKSFAKKVEAMFENDFADSYEEKNLVFSKLSLLKRIGSKFARLFSPIL